MPETKTEITSFKHIQFLVDQFYGKIKTDDLLGDIFNGIIQDEWPSHLDKMYRFWETVLLDKHTYKGSPFLPHAQLPVDKKHFERWLSLFTETVDDHFFGEKAEQAKRQAKQMAGMFQYKIEHYKKSKNKPLI